MRYESMCFVPHEQALATHTSHSHTVRVFYTECHWYVAEAREMCAIYEL